MRHSQSGVSLMGLIFGLFILVILALFAMKLVPSFLEFRSAKAAIDQIATTAQGAGEVRRQFESRAAIDDINSIKPTDLEVTREGNQTVIAFAYRKEVPLVGAVGLYIDYAHRTGGGQ